jgi:heptosyltransferase-2
VNDWLVLRFGALGDLCLLGWSLSALADQPDAADRRLTLVTKAGFAPLAAHFHGVDRVVALDGSGLAHLTALAGQLRGQRWHRVVDAHHILRSHALLTLVGRRADARLAKDTAARLRLLAGEAAPASLQRTMVDRFDEVLGLVEAAAPGVGPAIDSRRPPLAGLAPDAEHGKGGAAPLGLAPGARWATKRWPEHHWIALVEALAAAGERDLRIFLGPDERAWFDGSRLAAAGAAAGATLIEGRSLVDVARELARCRALATNDSGLLHLAEATGTPVLAFFGPTVRAFGYFPRLPRSRGLEHELECRPCSRNGKRPCHRGDLACLEAITPATAALALRAVGSPA